MSFSPELVVDADNSRPTQLTEAEEVALRTGDVGPDFYAALERSRTVHADCQQLLTTAAQQTTALGVMEHMSTLQEAALERLYRWTSSQCRYVGNPVQPHRKLGIPFPIISSLPFLHEAGLNERSRISHKSGAWICVHNMPFLLRSSQIECLSPENSAMLSTAMRHLQERPVMFR